MLDAGVSQLSGLTVLFSRGVGSLQNRLRVVEHIRNGGSRFIHRFLKGASRRLGNLDAAIEFVREQHDPPKLLHEIPHAYITPNPM
jgi:hypothetical protein